MIKFWDGSILGMLVDLLTYFLWGVSLEYLQEGNIGKKKHPLNPLIFWRSKKLTPCVKNSKYTRTARNLHRMARHDITTSFVASDPALRWRCNAILTSTYWFPSKPRQWPLWSVDQMSKCSSMACSSPCIVWGSMAREMAMPFVSSRCSRDPSGWTRLRGW
jgi:hypothetical protein